jgi:hypothetical protein
MKKISRAKRAHLIGVASENEKQQLRRSEQMRYPLIVVRVLDMLSPAARKAARAMAKLLKSMSPLVLPPGADLTWLSPGKGESVSAVRRVTPELYPTRVNLAAIFGK